MKSLSTIRPQPRLISALFITFFTLSAFGLSALGVDSKTKVDLSSINPQEKSEIAVSFDSVLAKAEKGDAEAQNKAGEMLHFGESVRPNYQAALKWYLKASEQGHPIAPNHIGRIYLNGEGVARDPKEAAKWYLLSAERGYAVAMYNIGSCYETGSGVPKNSAKAKEWFDRAEKTQPGIIQLIKQKKLN